MSTYSLRVHVAKLKLLVPLHTSNHKLLIKIAAMHESRTINAPLISNQTITKTNGMIPLQEDVEYTLNSGANKLGISVYAIRTFKEDVLLFFNDVSLKKALSTENIVKIECKLYNIDRVHVANLYLEMQRKGSVMVSDDFMADITQRLNLESTRMISDHGENTESKKSSGFFQSLGSNKKSSKDSTVPYAQQVQTTISSAGDNLSQAMGIRQIGFNSSSRTESKPSPGQAIPNLDAFQLSDNFQKFVKSLDPLVALYEGLFSLVTIQKKKDTLLFLLLTSLAIIYFKALIVFLPIGLVVFIFYNFYFKREFKKPDINYIKNMRFIQMLMGQTHESVVMGYDFISDFIYWRQPEKTLFLTKELCKASIGLCIGLYVIKIKYLLVMGLWGGVLSNSEFCVTLFTVFSQKTIETMDALYKKVLMECLLKKNKLTKQKIKYPFQSLYKTIKGYIAVLKRKRPSYERQQSIDDSLFENIGQEHNDYSSRDYKNKGSEGAAKIRVMGNVENLKKSQTPQKQVKDLSKGISVSSLIDQEPLVINEQNHKYKSPRVEMRQSSSVNRRNGNNTPKSTGLLGNFFGFHGSGDTSKKQQRDKSKERAETDPMFEIIQNTSEYELDDDTASPSIHHKQESKTNGSEGDQLSHVFTTYENQRWWIGSWTGTLLPGERSNWSDQNGEMMLTKDSFKLPEKDWEWQTIWFIDKHPEFTDSDGWSYASDFHGPYKKNQGAFDVVRRRKWMRICKQKTPGQQNEELK